MGLAPERGLRVVSLLAANGFEFFRGVVACLSAATGLPISLSHTAPAGLAELVRAGAVDLAFTCGLPYVRVNAQAPPPLALLGAPVLAAERYAGRPVYFADFVVRAGSPHQTLADLRGEIFAFNQVESLSGYVLPLHYLLEQRLAPDFFGAWRATGSHAASLEAVLSGQAAAAAIDSMVLAMELRQRPERAAALRVIASAGPLAMPPVVAAASLPPAVSGALRAALCGLHTTPLGRSLLAQHGVARFAPVHDALYDDIRRVWAAVQPALQPQPN